MAFPFFEIDAQVLILAISFIFRHELYSLWTLTSLDSFVPCRACLRFCILNSNDRIVVLILSFNGQAFKDCLFSWVDQHPVMRLQMIALVLHSRFSRFQIDSFPMGTYIPWSHRVNSNIRWVVLAKTHIRVVISIVLRTLAGITQDSLWAFRFALCSWNWLLSQPLETCQRPSCLNFWRSICVVDKASLCSFTAWPFRREYRVFVAYVRLEQLQFMKVLVLLFSDVLNHAVYDPHSESFLHLFLVFDHHHDFLFRFFIILVVFSLFAASLWTLKSRFLRVEIFQDFNLFVFCNGSFWFFCQNDAIF